MNTPEFYLVEPYNAYTAQKGGRKKHWHEVIEEEALMQRIIAEQQALQEAQTSKTLPPNAPATSTPTVGGTPQAGAGGLPPWSAFHPENATVNFDRTPTTGAGPLTVTFTNLTNDLTLYSYLWSFGDGTTSTDVNPVHVYQSGSNATGIYTASLTATSNLLQTVAGTSPNVYTSASIPVVSAAYTVQYPATLTASFYTASAGATLQFVNGSTINNGTTLTYLWNFGSASAPTGYDTSTAPTPTYVFNTGATYTVLLSATGSYGIKSAGVRKIYITNPTVTASIAAPQLASVDTTGSAPFTVTFVNGSTYDTYADPTYLWVFGSGSAPANYITSTDVDPADQTFRNAGFYTVRLQVTASNGVKKSVALVKILVQ